jgi:gliding motility-associated-like protein
MNKRILYKFITTPVTSFIICVSILFFPNSVYAQSFPTPADLSTGQGTIGGADPIWTVSQNWYASLPAPNPMTLNYTTALINYTCAPGAWVDPAALPPPVNNGNWITGGEGSCATNTAAGYRFFRLRLNLPADCNGFSVTTPGAYSISFSGYADNSIANVYINGNPQGISGGSFSAGSQLNFTLNGPWQVGINYVDVLVYNVPNGGGTNPYGLLLVANANSPTDTDNDGVPNINDLCPCTPGNNAVGCMDPANPNNCNINLIRQTLTNAGNVEMVSCVDACSMYFLNPQSMTGSQAQAYARTFGANLVSVESQAENNCITSSLNAMGENGVVWIGLSDEITEGTFVWYDQAPVVYTNWAAGEPNQSGDEDCVQIYANGGWNDLSCNAAGAKSIIEVNLCPVVNAGNDVSICSTATANLQAANTILGSSPYTYQWNNGPTTQANPVSPTTTTTYTLTSTDRYSCRATDQVQVTVRPLPNVTAITNLDVCPQSTVNVPALGSNVAGTTYAWTNSNAAIGLAASGNGNIPSFTATNPGTTPITSTISITPTAAGCVGPVSTFTITVRPTTIVNPITDINICNGAISPAITLSSPIPGTTFSWSNNNTTANGIPASGSGNIPTYTATNTGITSITTTITVNPTLNGCPGTPLSFNIIVHPTPTVAPIIDQTYCNGVASTLTAPTGPVTGTTFSWTNSNTIIGLGASGNGNIPVFTTFNDGNAAYTGTVTVTPTANGCVGTPLNYNITVNPVPTVDPIGSQILCNGAASNLIAPDGDVIGSTFAWINDNSSIGLASTGNGNIPSFTATNITNAPVTANVTVTPSANACTGTSTQFTITVNPTPQLSGITDQTFCPGTTTPIIAPTPNVIGTTYSWTNNNTAIGLGASGNGDLPSFTATNPGSIQISSTITFTPTANGCVGLPFSFLINVSPTPTVTAITDLEVCNGVSTGLINPTGNIGTSSYSWSNDNTSIGLGANGTGQIPSFTAINTGNTAEVASITVTPSANSCTGTPSSFIITVNPTPSVTAINDQSICNGGNSPITPINGNVTGVTFDWTNDNSSIGLSANGIGDIPAFTATNAGNTPVTANISITPTANGCSGTPEVFIITVNPTPTVAPINSQTLCNGAATADVNFSETVNSTTFDWTNSDPTIGLAAAGNGDILSFAVTNNDTASVTATITVTPSANGCTGTAGTFDITVNPTPTVAPINSQTLCNGAATADVNFSGTVNSTTFDWTNSYPTIGLAAAGNGDILSFAVTNNDTASVTATITVTPSANGCTGTAETFDITVNPTPTVAPINSQTLCNGAATADVNFAGTVSGTSFAWTNSDPTIGLAAAGNGDILSFAVTNNDTASVTATITVTPSANGCTGTAGTFDITVNPTPTVAPINSQTLCNGAATADVNFSGTVNSTTFDWTNSYPTIGLAAAGNGDILSFAVTNNDTASVTATITVTPSANGCTGTAETFDITVNPTPTVAPINSQTLCEGSTTVDINFVGTVNGTAFNWTNSNPAIGLAGNGTGDILAFTTNNPGITPATATITVIPSANNCSGAVETFNIIVNPTFIGVPVSATICGGDSYAFGGQNFTATGSFPIIFQTVHGCDSTVTLVLTVNPSYNTIWTQTICTGASVAFAGNTYTTSGNYPFTFQTINGCDSTVTLALTVTPNPAVVINPQPDQCFNGHNFNFSLGQTFAPGSTTNWTFTGANTTTSPDVAPQNITYPAPGQYNVVVDVVENSCQLQGTLTVNVLAQPITQFNTNPPLGCIPFEVKFTNLTTGGGDILWTFAGGTPSSSTATSPTIVYNTPGQHTVVLTVTYPNGCSDTETSINLINAQSPPTAGFSIQPEEINMGNPTTTLIDGSNGATSVYYYVGDYSGVPGPTTPFTFTEEGSYEVMQVVTSFGGCTDTAYGQVIVNGNTEVFIPNAFTPNNDDLNSRFRVYGNGFSDFHIMIFNRWGELLFESYDENQGWDGTFGGKPLLPEVYVYKVELKDFRKSLKSYMGSVTLVR